MKKLIILLGLLTVTISANAVEQATEVKTNVNQVKKEKINPQKFNRDHYFEKRLGLTEVQKLKASQIRKNGHDKLKPVIEQIVA